MTLAPLATNPEPQTLHSFLDQIGIPTVLVWEFLGLLLFMIGDGVESGYLSPYLVERGLSNGAVPLSLPSTE